MALSKCVRCEKLFDRAQSPVCQACAPDEERDRELVRDALTRYGALNADEICQITDVDRRCVERMLDEGVIADQTTSAEFKCGRCGRPAISAAKRICQACLSKMNRTIQETKQDLARTAPVPQRRKHEVSPRATLLRKRGYSDP